MANPYALDFSPLTQQLNLLGEQRRQTQALQQESDRQQRLDAQNSSLRTMQEEQMRMALDQSRRGIDDDNAKRQALMKRFGATDYSDALSKQMTEDRDIKIYGELMGKIDGMAPESATMVARKYLSMFPDHAEDAKDITFINKDKMVLRKTVGPNEMKDILDPSKFVPAGTYDIEARATGNPAAPYAPVGYKLVEQKGVNSGFQDAIAGLTGPSKAGTPTFAPYDKAAAQKAWEKPGSTFDVTQTGNQPDPPQYPLSNTGIKTGYEPISSVSSDIRQAAAEYGADPDDAVKAAREEYAAQKIQGKPVRVGKTTMTPEYNLLGDRKDEGKGTTVVVGGAGAGKVATRPIPNAIQTEVGTLAKGLDGADWLNRSFANDYAGMVSKNLGQGLLEVKKRFGEDSPQAFWWMQYQERTNYVRNELFGSALTPSEQQEYNKANIHPGMNPALVKRNLEKQEAVVGKALYRRTAGNAKAYDKESLEIMAGRSIDDLKRYASSPNPDASASTPIKPTPGQGASTAGFKSRIDAILKSREKK